jgi:hypothetical protein
MTDSASTRNLHRGLTRAAYHRVMRTLLAGVALATMLLASVAAAAGSPSGVRVIHAKQIIESFAIGGHRIAYDLQGSLTCNKVLVLDLRTGKTRRVSGKQTCLADSTSTGAGVRELAIAGNRIAWIVNKGGNTESDDYLYTASLPRPKERRLAAAQRLGDINGVLTGNWIANLVASGDVLAVNRWSSDESGLVTRSSIDVLARTGLRLRRIASSRGAVLGQAADAGRVAVLYGDSSVEIYAGNGKRLLKLKPPASPREIALRGDYLLVLTETPTLEIYNARTGSFLRSWPVQARAAEELDAYAGVAIYVAKQSGKIHAVQLKTGKDVVVAPGNWQLRQSAELEPAGLLYAKDRHNLVLLPFKNVLAAVS